ncbi:MAG: serine protease [Deltaproteobacteria bacterium]|nr:serine protease [Deltaproteobacteria bacterium]
MFFLLLLSWLGLFCQNLEFVGVLSGISRATGFVVEGKIIAPFHFVLKNCTERDCVGEFSLSNSRCKKLQIRRYLTMADLAVLECLDNEFRVGGFKLRENFNYHYKKGRVLIPVYKGEKFTIKNGRIKWNSRLMYVISSRLGFGASGSPVFDDNGNIVGVVTRAENLRDGLLGTFIPWHRFSVKAVKVKYVAMLLKRQRGLHIEVAKDLIGHYRQYVRNQSKFKRFVESIEFTGLINKYIFDFKKESEVNSVFILRENEFWQKAHVEKARLYPLLFVYHLEKFGLFGIEDTCQRDICELLDVFKRSKFRGQWLFVIGFGILLCIWLSFLIFISLAVSYAKLKQ